jgi:peptidoglycan hydrolase-like protein with peptidoglycan-binding domain
MKKLLLAFTAFAFLVPSLSLAQTTPTSTPITTAFSRNLSIGSQGTDVSQLQAWLIGKGYSVPAGASGYFGIQTKKALASYQAANGITPASGYFGSITRAVVNTKTVSSVSTIQSTATVQTISPNVIVKPVATSTSSVTTTVSQLTQEVNSLQAQLASYRNTPVTTSAPVATTGLSAQMGLTSALFQANHSFDTSILGKGQFDLHFSVTAGNQTIFVPLTVGTTATSGVAYIVTSPNQLQAQPTVTINVQCYGDGISSIYADVGYCKIPAGQTAQFYVSASIPAPTGSSYSINVNQINYKSDPLDASYSTYRPSQKIATPVLMFTAN